jgi:hypothetical protein
MILNHYFRQVLAEEHIRELRRKFGTPHSEPVAASGGQPADTTSQPQSRRLVQQELIPARTEKR